MTTKVHLNSYFSNKEVELNTELLKMILSSRLDIEWVEYNPDVFFYIWRNSDDESVSVSDLYKYKSEELDIPNLVNQCTELLMQFGVTKKHNIIGTKKFMYAYDLEIAMMEYLPAPKGKWGSEQGISWDMFLDDCLGWQEIWAYKGESVDKVLLFLDDWFRGTCSYSYSPLEALSYLLVEFGILEHNESYLVYLSD